MGKVYKDRPLHELLSLSLSVYYELLYFVKDPLVFPVRLLL